MKALSGLKSKLALVFGTALAAQACLVVDKNGNVRAATDFKVAYDQPGSAIERPGIVQNSTDADGPAKADLTCDSGKAYGEANSWDGRNSVMVECLDKFRRKVTAPENGKATAISCQSDEQAQVSAYAWKGSTSVAVSCLPQEP